MLSTYMKAHLGQEENELIFSDNSTGYEDQGENGSEKAWSKSWDYLYDTKCLLHYNLRNSHFQTRLDYI